MWARSCIVAAIVGIALLLADPRASLAWVTQLHGSVGIDDPPRSIARDPAGDLLAASARGVAKYDGGSGDTVWSIPADSAQQYADYPIAVDGHGDLVTFEPCCGDGGATWHFVKRSGVDGRILWHVAPPAGFDGTPMFAPDGDVIVVGGVESDLAVLEIDGARGTLAWFSILPAEGWHGANASVVDARGDVAVGGTLLVDGRARAVVTKVSGADGRLVWRKVVEGAAPGIDSIVVGPGGDLFVAGSEVESSPVVSLHFLVARLGSATGELLWRNVSVPGRGSGTYRGAALATDSAGGVVVGGFVVDSNGQRQPTVARLRADGSVAWQRTLAVRAEVTTVAVVGNDVVLGGMANLTSTGSDLAVFDVALADGTPRWQLVIEDDGDQLGNSLALAVVPDGNTGVFVSGRLAYAGSGRDVLMARLRVADGAASWQQGNETTANVDETAVAVALDPHGDLLVGGELGSPATGLRVGVVKLDAGDGSEIWRTVIPGLSGSGRTAVDRDGNVLASGITVIGTSEPPGSGGPFDPGTPAPVALTVVKVAGADGGELWRTVVDAGSGRAQAGETVVANDGSVFVAAWLWYPQGPSVVKLDGTTGAVQWVSPFAPMTHQFAASTLDAWLVVLGPDDDLFVAGPSISSTGNHNVAVSRLDARSGARLWGVALPDAWLLTGLALDGRGDLVLAASTVESPAHRLVAKVVGANGTLLWRTEMSKGTNLGVALTDDGDVLAAGSAIVGDPAFETAVVLSVAKLDGTTGAGLWEYRSDFALEGEALQVVADHAGDAWVAGSLDSGSGEQSFAVLKLDGVGGEPRWTRLVPGSGTGAGGEATDLVLDGAGRVVAVGSLTGDGTALDFGVASLDAATGGDGTTCRFRRSCGGTVPRVVIPRTPGGRLPLR